MYKRTVLVALVAFSITAPAMAEVTMCEWSGSDCSGFAEYEAHHGHTYWEWSCDDNGDGVVDSHGWGYMGGNTANGICGYLS